MAGYLDHYGENDARREKLIKYTALTLLAALVLGGGLYFWFKNYRQERQVQQFFELLARKDYLGAYALWGCTEATPCREYPLDAFMKDWAPRQRDPSTYSVVKSRSCGSGVIITVDTGLGEGYDKLWVERKDLTLAFSPYPGCPPGR